MFDRLDTKYSKFLTILLIVVIVGIVGLLGYLGVDLFKKIHTENDAEKFAQQFEDDVTGKDNEDNSDAENPLDGIESSESANGKTYKYKGFDVAGTIEIPKTNDLIQNMLTIVPLQVLSYEIAKLRGCDIDKPKNLAKSVTVE